MKIEKIMSEIFSNYLTLDSDAKYNYDLAQEDYLCGNSYGGDCFYDKARAIDKIADIYITDYICAMLS